MEQEQQDIGLDKPPVQYVDAAFTSTQELMKAAAEGRELIGPAPGAASKDDPRFCTDHFNIRVEQRQAICPAGHQKHRALAVGEHHTVLQGRRRGQKTEPFKQRMKHRNAIEGTQSELVRAHGLRRARYRSLAKVRLQNYFIGAACNVKRWLRRAVFALVYGVLCLLFVVNVLGWYALSHLSY